MFMGCCMIKTQWLRATGGYAAIAVSYSGSVSMLRSIGETSESSSLLLKPLRRA